ncbi:MAG: DUF4190 domain-containing protein [Planctomycetaceae bacterium]|nr:DUF4190 domain-containing protein [Planctomycetaceae bacterium]
MTSARHCPRGHPVPTELENCPVCGETPAEETARAGHSLWDVMKQADSSGDPDQETVAPPVGDRDEPLDEPDTVADEPRPRGLWEVMQKSSPTVSPLSEPIELDDLVKSHAESPPGPETDQDIDDGQDEETAEPMGPDKDEDGKNDWAGKPADRSRRCRASLILGVLAMLLAGVGLLPPEFWTRLPALFAGLAAVYTGLVGIDEIRSASRPATGRLEAISGIGLGTLGMFLTRILDALL